MFHPFGNETVSPPAQWHPEPTTRGTFSVLSSCLLTMLLCVWTAVHLNLPEHGKEHHQSWRKAGWLTLGLLAPEVVAWNAWVQRRTAKKLTRDMQALQRRRVGVPEEIGKTWYRSLSIRLSKFALVRWAMQAWRALQVWLLCRAEDLDMSAPDDWPSHGDNETDLWSDVHSWYSIMGGFAFDTSAAAKPFLPRKWERVVLTPEGILVLAEHWPSLLPKLTADDIWDKSKSDGLAKFLSCWQAAWFCVQCAFRLANGLPVSFLELNVFAHAICALLTYAIWWNKPKDILEPTKLSGRESDAVAALLCNFSPMGAPRAKRRDNGGIHFWSSHTPSWVHAVPDEADEGFPEFIPERTHVMQVAAKSVTAPGALRIGNSYWRLDFPLQQFDDCIITVDAVVASRLRLLQSFEAGNPLWNLTRTVTFVSSKMDDWSISEPADWVNPALKERCHYGILVACALYGGMHSVAWHAAFPSTFEQLLWRAASLTVALTGPTWLFFIAISAYESLEERRLDLISGVSMLEGILWGVLRVLKPFIGGLVVFIYLVYPMWYLFCRAFLVVECFINVAHLSEGALRVPVWSTYIPHLS